MFIIIVKNDSEKTVQNVYHLNPEKFKSHFQPQIEVIGEAFKALAAEAQQAPLVISIDLDEWQDYGNRFKNILISLKEFNDLHPSIPILVLTNTENLPTELTRYRGNGHGCMVSIDV